MESSLGCSRGQRVFGPAHRLGQWQRVEVSEGGTPADVTAVQRPPFTPRMCCYEMMTTAACHPRVEGGLLVVLEWPAMRDHGAEKRRPSQGEEFGMCNWDRAHVPPEVIRPRIGLEVRASSARRFRITDRLSVRRRASPAQRGSTALASSKKTLAWLGLAWLGLGVLTF